VLFYLLLIEVVEVSDILVNHVSSLEFGARRRFVRQRAVITSKAPLTTLVYEASSHELRVLTSGKTATAIKNVGCVTCITDALGHDQLVLVLM